MDGKTFDRLTKGLSSGASRRRMLGGLGLAVAGLLTGRRGPAEARPVSEGCSKAGRICEGAGTQGTCCGSKLTCSAAGGLSGNCTNTPQNAKCCAQPGTACQGNCECCGAENACINGRCGPYL
jgi:hypothetical protein